MLTKFLKDTTEEKMTYFVICLHSGFSQNPENKVNSLTYKNKDRNDNNFGVFFFFKLICNTQKCFFPSKFWLW